MKLNKNDGGRMLYGIEDVPLIADENCGQCGAVLTRLHKLDNFSGWFGFVKKDNQLYQIPLCVSCDKENSKGGLKVDD